MLLYAVRLANKARMSLPSSSEYSKGSDSFLSDHCSIHRSHSSAGIPRFICDCCSSISFFIFKKSRGRIYIFVFKEEGDEDRRVTFWLQPFCNVGSTTVIRLVTFWLSGAHLFLADFFPASDDFFLQFSCFSRSSSSRSWRSLPSFSINIDFTSAAILAVHPFPIRIANDLSSAGSDSCSQQKSKALR